VTYMLLLNCALKMVEEIILYYDARSKEHQITLEEVTANELRICTPTQNYDFMGQHYS